MSARGGSKQDLLKLVRNLQTKVAALEKERSIRRADLMILAYTCGKHVEDARGVWMDLESLHRRLDELWENHK